MNISVMWPTLALTKLEKKTISLRNDVWHNPKASIELQARVINAEDTEDVTGQYIIFCHVFDDQVKLYGRVRFAVEEIIRICQDKNVLREYLESRKKEVITIMNTLLTRIMLQLPMAVNAK